MSSWGLDFAVLHQVKSLQQGPIALPNKYIEFDTCLRRLTFVPGFVSKDTLINETAYQLILEVICGLHSRVIGETEILGQFKNFIQKTKFSEINKSLSPVFRDLLTDAKIIREKYFRHTGPHSYGSYLRLKSQTASKIDIIGTGHLAQELALWTPRAITTFYARNLNSESSKKIKQLGYNLKPLADLSGVFETLVIAAPIENCEVAALLLRSNTVLDFRENTEILPQLSEQYFSLNQVFEEIEKTNHHLDHLKKLALIDIEFLVQKRMSQHWCRPYGWEDAWG